MNRKYFDDKRTWWRRKNREYLFMYNATIITKIISIKICYCKPVGSYYKHRDISRREEKKFA
jgi:hypothetical protein